MPAMPAVEAAAKKVAVAAEEAVALNLIPLKKRERNR